MKPENITMTSKNPLSCHSCKPSASGILTEIKRDSGQAGMPSIVKFRLVGCQINTFFILLTALSLMLSGCALPKIIILKDPLTPQEHINLGVAYENKGELDAAIREYKTAAKKTGSAYLYLGNAFFLKKDFPEAEKYYKKALDKEPLNADAYNNLAWLYFTEGKNLDKAKGLAEKAIELNPSRKDIYTDTLEKIREASAGK